MSNEQVLALIESLGDDAKIAFIAFLIMDYGSAWVVIALVTWGIRTLWKKRGEWVPKD